MTNTNESCPGLESVMKYALNDLRGQSGTEVAAHVEECKSCNDQYRYEKLRAGIGKEEDAPGLIHDNSVVAFKYAEHRIDGERLEFARLPENVVQYIEKHYQECDSCKADAKKEYKNAKLIFKTLLAVLDQEHLENILEL